MDVNSLAIRDRCSTGMTIFRMNTRLLSLHLLEDLDVPNRGSRFGIEAHRAQGLITRVAVFQR